MCREALRIKGLTLIIAIDFTKIFLSKDRIMQYLAVWAKCLLEFLLVTMNKHRSRKLIEIKTNFTSKCSHIYTVSCSGNSPEDGDATFYKPLLEIIMKRILMVDIFTLH